MSTETLVFVRDDHGVGWLAIRDEATEYSQPVRVVLYWPVEQMGEGLAQSHYGVPRAARHRGDGCYTLGAASDGLAYFKDSVRLKDGGKTQPIKQNRLEIPRPKCRVETRYKYGRWEKNLMHKGWVPA